MKMLERIRFLEIEDFCWTWRYFFLLYLMILRSINQSNLIFNKFQLSWKNQSLDLFKKNENFIRFQYGFEEKKNFQNQFEGKIL